MGIVTITVKDEVEKEFRKWTRKERGTGKGVLGKAVTEALNKWVEEQKQKNIAQEALELLKKGFDMGKFKLKCREELYEKR